MTDMPRPPAPQPTAAPHVRYAQEGGVAELVLEHGARRNALTLAMWQALPRLVARAEKARSVLGLVLRGAGAHFCAGADITEFDALTRAPARRAAYRAAVAAGSAALDACAKPVVAAIEGDCMGGGVAVALACDYVVAGAGARFCLPPARLGLVYPPEDARRLMLRVGAARARHLLWQAREFSAAEALAWGLIDARAPKAKARAAALAELAHSEKLSQWSIRASKRMLRLLLAEPSAAQRKALAALNAESFRNPDFVEGVRAFRERRRPDFSFR